MFKHILIGILVFVFFYIVLFCLYPMDDTDKDFFNRSGLALMIDNRTGCHYVGSLFGSATPRLDRDGKHICDTR